MAVAPLTIKDAARATLRSHGAMYPLHRRRRGPLTHPQAAGRDQAADRAAALARPCPATDNAAVVALDALAGQPGLWGGPGPGTGAGPIPGRMGLDVTPIRAGNTHPLPWLYLASERRNQPMSHTRRGCITGRNGQRLPDVPRTGLMHPAHGTG